MLDERRKLIAKLEAGGRSPSSIVYESLINMGLNLMASPEANFTQALGQAGQAGFATFQNLRKEEKERVKDLHKMSYDFQKDRANIVNYWVKKYGSLEDAIFQMNGHILDLRGTVKGMRELYNGDEK